MAKALGFERVRELLARVGGPGGGSIASGDTIRISARTVFTAKELAVVEESRTLTAALNKVLTNAGTRWVSAIRKVVVAKDTIRTRLFLSSWKAKRVKDRSSVNTAVEIVNDAPYALYVHPKGTSKTRTIFNVDVKRGLLPKFKVELTEDLERLRPQIAKALKADINKRARR